MIKQVAIDSIGRISNSLRQANMTEPDSIDLLNKIKKFGMQNIPLVVERTNPASGEVFYVRADGDRRITVVQDLNTRGEYREVGVPLGYVTVNVSDKDLSDDEIRDLQLMANQSIKQTTNKEYVDFIYSMMLTQNLSIAQLSERLSVSADWINKQLKTLALPDNVRGMISSGDIKTGHSIELAKVFNKLSPEEKQEILVDCQTQTLEEFTQTCENKLKAKKTGKPEGFVPIRRFVGKSEIENRLVKAQDDYAKDSNPVNKAVKDLLEELFSIDEVSIQQQKAEWDKKNSDKDNKKAEARAKAEQKALEALLSNGYTVKGKDGQEISLPKAEPTPEPAPVETPRSNRRNR